MSDVDITRIVEQHSSRVFNLAFRILSNRQDAEDVVQETFIQAYRNLDSFRGESNLSTWIYQIALNNCLKMKERFGRQYVESLDEKIEAFQDDIPQEVKDWSTDPERSYLLRELLDQIRQGCLQFLSHRLPEKQRTVFIMVNVLDFSYQETAEILGISTNVVKARLNRARTSLREFFEHRCRWIDEHNPCSCESRIGFALAYDPELLKRVRMKIGDPPLGEADGILEEVKDIVASYRRLPKLSYPAESLRKLTG